MRVTAPRPPTDAPAMGARRAVAAAVIRPSAALVLVLTLAFAAGLRVPELVQYLPFAASLVLFGLPHGALDHLVPSRLTGRPPDAPGVLGVVLLYGVLSSLCLALWFVSPAAAFVSFICITAFHWGAGDLHATLFFGPPALSRTGKTTRALLLAGRGLVPMLVPLVFFPDAYRKVAADAADLFGSAVGPDVLFSPGVRAALFAGLVVLVALSLLLASRDLGREWGSLLPLLGETVLLFVFFMVVPPVLAVGLYFAAWHAPRHIARLILLDPAEPGRGSWARAVGRFGRDAAPLTGVALILLAALYFAVPAGEGDAGSLLALYLVLVSALTVPHAAVVAYMDARQGLWKH